MADEPLKGEALAREMAQQQAQQAQPPTEAEDEIDEGFLDFAETYREAFKESAPSGFGKSGLVEEGKVPPRFEDVSLCMDCRHCHSVTVPVNVRIAVGETGQRMALGKIRRCLLGLKLESDDSPEMYAAVRKGAQMAPLAVECSHFNPWTSAELLDMEFRREQHVERMKKRREEQAALDETEAQANEETK